jgi:hypothetical protein
MKIDPHSDLLRKPPLPRSTGERKRRLQGLAPFLYPTKVGERWPAKRDGVGVIRPYAIALPLQGKVTARVLPLTVSADGEGGSPYLSLPIEIDLILNYIIQR